MLFYVFRRTLDKIVLNEKYIYSHLNTHDSLAFSLIAIIHQFASK